MRINDSIIYRFEEKLNNGAGELYIFDIKNYKTYKGGKMGYEVLRLIDLGANATEITIFLEEKYSITNCDREVIHLINNLVAKQILIRDSAK